MLEGFFIVATGVDGLPVLAFFHKGLNLAGTAERPGAAYIHVAFLLEVWQLEVSQHREAVVVGIVVMPLVSIRVDEEDVVGKGVIMVDYVSVEMSY